MDHNTPLVRPSSVGELFVAFTLLALQGFGGVLAVAQRALCERRRWLSAAQFVELLALAQVLPGPNVCNLALMVGDRFFGWRGAAAALAGLLAVPLALVLVATALYAQFALLPAVAGALHGMNAVAAGLVIAAALKLMPSLRGGALRLPESALVGAAMFIAVQWLRWPLIWTLAGIGALSCAIAWRRIGASSAEKGA